MIDRSLDINQHAQMAWLLECSLNASYGDCILNNIGVRWTSPGWVSFRTYEYRFGREPSARSAAQSGMVLFGTNAFSLLYYMECHYLPYTDTIIEYQKSTFHYYVLSWYSGAYKICIFPLLHMIPSLACQLSELTGFLPTSSSHRYGWFLSAFSKSRMPRIRQKLFVLEIVLNIL